MTRRAFVAGLVAILLAGATLRVLWLRADPPTSAVGIVWHDEGAWVHNARNRALWGVWRTDEWNPVFIAPVFTALEYAAFKTAGVGTWQARTVPLVSGLAAILLVAAGVARLAGSRAGLIAGALLATNYVFVMWNRAALMESTMTAFIVAGWAFYALAERRAAWGLAAGVAAVLAWFTKAAAAFFIAAIVIEALISLMLDRRRARFAWWTLGGVAVAGLAFLLLFVAPYWTEYSFYNWQMTVTRKPEYSLEAFVMRASWLPVVQSYFSRMWLIVVASAIVIAGVAAGWRAARPAERLLALWVLLGFVELIVHDAGAERRYVMFIPAFVALTAILVGSRRSILPAAAHIASSHRWLLLPIFMLLAYLVVGSLVRQLFLDEIAAGNYRSTVRISAALAAVLGLWLVWAWPAVTRRLSTVQVPLGFVAAALIIAVSWNLTQYVLWARVRDDLNYRASIEVGRQLAPGTLVHGKLANGLALENQIRPLFVGMGFGNYADRLRRDDARYILTYTSPELGYESGHEGRLIQELLNQYPTHRMVATFEVEETPGMDRAALIDKFPNRARD